MMDDEDDFDWRIARSLPEFDDQAVERLRAELPIHLWPLALEYPEDEGDIPSELQPLRSRAHGRWEEIIAISSAPLSIGDTFTTHVRDGQGRTTRNTNTYRVHGRTPGSRHDWLVVEQLPRGGARPSEDARPGLVVGYDDGPGRRRVVAKVADSRWTLGVDARSGRHVARAVSGAPLERHAHSRDAITRALVDAHMMRDEPLPNIREAEQRHWRRSGERYRETLRPFEWVLGHEHGARVASGVVEATGYRHALDLATRDAFGSEPEEPPVQDTGTRRVWSHVRPALVLEVRRMGGVDLEKQS